MVTPIPGQPIPSSSLQRHTCGTQVHTQTHNFKKNYESEIAHCSESTATPNFSLFYLLICLVCFEMMHLFHCFMFSC